MVLTRRRVLAGVAALAAGSGALWARAAGATYYDGPASDHFDGLRFFDPHGAPPKGLLDLARWRLTAARADWPQNVPAGPPDRPPERLDDGHWRIAWVGHATFLIQAGGLNLLTDPVWSERASPVSFAGPRRVAAPGIALDALPPLDAILVSHNHYDHLDMATLSDLARTQGPRVITPLGNDTIMRAADPGIRAEAYDWHQRIDLGHGCAAIAVPTRHWSARGLFDRNKALWAGFIIETPQGRILFVGDSGYGDGGHFRRIRERYGPIRLALLPIGAYEPRWFMRDQHMNPREAVRAMADCGASLALGHHFGTFQLTDEAIDAPLLALAEARAEAGIGADAFRTLTPGNVWSLAA